MSNYLNKIVYLTDEQYETLTNIGSITINGTTHQYDQNTLYITKTDLTTTSPSASGNATAFITDISQDKTGKITVSKANLDTSGTWSGNAVTATNATNHIARTDNPHSVTKAQVGLNNVTNHAQVTSLAYDSTNRKITYKVSEGTAQDLVTFGTNAFNSTAYLPTAGGTVTGNLILSGTVSSATTGSTAAYNESLAGPKLIFKDDTQKAYLFGDRYDSSGDGQFGFTLGLVTDQSPGASFRTNGIKATSKLVVGTTFDSTYAFKVSGASHFNGNTTITGNVIFPNASSILDWNDGTYRQRIAITDDSTANTAVFTFQQSSDSGSNYTDLFTIKDNGGITAHGGIGVANTTSTTGIGISLYGGAKVGAPDYGLMFAGTGTFGKLGGVTSDWATYFTMSDTTTRGWIFRRGSTNVASIDGTGLVFAGRGNFAGTSTTETTSGNYYNTGALEIRESNRVANAQSDFAYAPRIGFHWSGHVGGSLSLHSTGTFFLRRQNGTSRASLDANLIGNASSATKIAATLAATTKTYLLGTSTVITDTASNVDLIGDTGIYTTTIAGELSAVHYSYNVSGTEKAYTYYNTTDNSIDFVFI